MWAPTYITRQATWSFPKLDFNNPYTSLKKTASRLLKKHPSDHKHKLIALTFRGNQLLSYGFNVPKTHTYPATVASHNRIDRMYSNSDRDYVSACIHAEWAAAKQVSGNFDTVFVYRETKDGFLANARPCLLCQAILKTKGCKTILFSTDKGTIEKEQL